MSRIIEPLQIESTGRYRLTLRHDGDPGRQIPIPLCNCDQAHASPEEAANCPHALANLDTEYPDDN